MVFFKKSQSSMEFLTLLGFMMLVFAGFFFVVQSRLTLETQYQKQEDLTGMANLIESELLVANSLEDGFVRPLDLPSTINGVSYTWALNDSDEIVIKTTDYERILFLPFEIKLLYGNDSSLTQGVINTSFPILQKTNDTVYIQIATAGEVCDGLDNDGDEYRKIDNGVLVECNKTINNNVHLWACPGDEISGYDCPEKKI